MRQNAEFKVVQGTVPHSRTTADFHPGVPSQLCPFQPSDGCLADDYVLHNRPASGLYTTALIYQQRRRPRT